MTDFYFRWPVIIEQSKKSPFQRLRNVLLFLLPVLFFVIAVYLIFQKLQKPPLAQIEEHLSRQEFKEALELAQQELEKTGPNRLRYLMLATVAAEAIQGTELPDYENQLRQEDQSGIYLKESYLKRFDVIPSLPSFPILLVNYAELFQIDQPSEDFLNQLQKQLDTDKAWLPLSESQTQRFFELMVTLFPQRILSVMGDNLQLRKQPSLEAETISKLSLGTKVLYRARGPELTIAGRRSNWLYVFTQDQLSGWVFGGYLK